MKNLIRFFEENVERYSDNPYMWEKRDGKFQPTTYREMHRQVRSFAAGLHQLGVKKGDRITLLAEGRVKWVVAEMGMFYVGAIDVPLSIQLNESTDLIFRIRHSESSIAVVSSNQAHKIKAIRQALPDLKKIILMDPAEKYAADEISMDEVMQIGESYLDQHPEEFHI